MNKDVVDVEKLPDFWIVVIFLNFQDYEKDSSRNIIYEGRPFGGEHAY